MKKYKNKLIIAGTLLAIIFYFLPFFLLGLGQNQRDVFFQEYLLNILYGRLTKDAQSDTDKVMKCVDFVNHQIAIPKKDILVELPLEVLVNGFGYCNEQTKLLMRLVEKGDFESTLVHLYGYDTISHHTVCEIKIADKFLLFDPFHKLYFNDDKGDLATIKDIQNNTFTPLPDTPELPAGYLKLFAKKNPYRIHRRNNIHKKIDGWYYLHKDYFLKPYLYLYFFMDGSDEQKRQRLMQVMEV